MTELSGKPGDGEHLSAEQKRCLDEISHVIGRPMRRIGTISWDSVGYTVDEGTVSGLSLYGCGLATLPRSVDCLSDLKHINLRRNDFMEFPTVLAESPGIEIVSCERNQIMALPRFENSASSLRAIYASHNRITALSDDIGLLARLEVLDLDQNRVVTLPESIGGLVSLTDLNLGSKKVSTLADPDVYGEEPLKRYLFGAHPPRSPFELQAILLRQTFNAIEFLPASMGSLKSLRTLSLVSNRLRELPKSLGQMSCIREIDVSYNRLQTIPTTLATLPRLDLLDVSYNQLVELPKALSNCAGLRRLLTQGNPLAQTSNTAPLEDFAMYRSDGAVDLKGEHKNHFR